MARTSLPTPAVASDGLTRARCPVNREATAHAVLSDVESNGKC